MSNEATSKNCKSFTVTSLGKGLCMAQHRYWRHPVFGCIDSFGPNEPTRENESCGAHTPVYIGE